jgi:hypothetical protein
MKVLLSVLIAFALLGCIALAQDKPSQEASSGDNATVLAEFTRSAKLDGLVLNFVHINNRTVDILFPGPEKYSMRARANLMTLIYVQGTPEKEIQVNPDFIMKFGGDTISAESHNIKNFEAGSVAMGERIDGLLIFAKKLKPSDPFHIIGNNTNVTFRFSDVALRMLGK